MFGDIAIVRLVWTLTVAPKDGGPAIATPERGLDVFRKQPDGQLEDYPLTSPTRTTSARTVTRG